MTAPASIIMLSDLYRVRPLDHLQWVLERKDGRGIRLQPVTEVWRPIAYCRTRVGLETALSRLRCEAGIHLDPSLIAHLPDFYSPPSRREAASAARPQSNRAVEA
jgi:hypothetical protein